MKTIGVFFGSRNTEHDISIITAQMIISGLRDLNYKIVPIYISKEGKWMIDDRLGHLGTFVGEKRFLESSKSEEFFLDLEESDGKLVFKKKGFSGKKIVVDIAFPALHGAYGEDGTIQGLFEIFKVPYVGCGVAASAIAMDKAFSKQMFIVNDIATTKFVCFTKMDWQKDKESTLEKIKNLKWPLFVKPVHLGSSIGISRVVDEDWSELENKIDVAFFYDDKVLVEEGVQNLMDVTCCVIGREEPIASLLQESVFGADLFDFDEKYLKDGGSQLGKSQGGIVIPARLDNRTTLLIQEAAKKIYKAMSCSGIARIDFLYDTKSSKFYANEINPLPGTLYHHLWKESGIELNQLIEMLIEYAIDEQRQKENLAHTFDSSVLTSLKGKKLGSKI